MKRTKILLISYYFPPLGGAGISRPMTLFKKLPEYGIDVDVLTVKNIAYRTYEPELLLDLHLDRIYRSSSFDPQRILYLMGMRKVKEKTVNKGRSLIDNFFPDSKIGWVKQAVKLGRTLVENKQYDLIMSTSPPISTHLIGKQLSKEFSLPYIADFRDYWSAYKPEKTFESKRHINKAYKLIEEICSTAEKVTTVSKPIQEFLKTGEVIHNSYDETRAKLWSDFPDKSYFYIGVLGTLDKMRSIEPLCKLLDKIRNSDSSLFDKIRVVQVGNINDPQFDNLLDKYALKNIFEIHNQKDRVNTIKILNKSSMLYIGLEPNCDDGVVTSRLYDMIVSGRPIIASVSKSSEITKILETIPQTCCYQDETMKIAFDFVTDKIKNKSNNFIKLKPISDSILAYSSGRMAEKFSVIIKNILEEKRGNNV